MRVYKASGFLHKVYDDKDELPENIVLVPNWRKAKIGDWVEADYGCVIQVLRRGKMKKKMGRNKISEYIGTCTGTFLVSKTVKMDTSKRENIYSFSGRKVDDVVQNRTKLNNFELLFVTYVAKGVNPVEAYLKAFPTKNRNYAHVKSSQLMRTERIYTAMKEELKPVCEELGIDNKTVLKDIQDASKHSEKEDVRLRALFKLADILDLEDKNQTKITHVSGALFQGFSPEQLEQAERPQITEGNNDGK